MYTGEVVGFATLSSVLSRDGGEFGDKNVLIKELSDCSDYEMKVILLVVKSLRDILKSENVD